MQKTTTEVTTVVITHERAQEIFRNMASDDTEIQQIKDYVKAFPRVIATPAFGLWVQANRQAINEYMQHQE